MNLTLRDVKQLVHSWFLKVANLGIDVCACVPKVVQVKQSQTLWLSNTLNGTCCQYYGIATDTVVDLCSAWS